MIEFNISKKLTESNPDRDVARPLSATEADEGAMCVGAALTLTRKSSIVLPDRPGGSIRAASSIKATEALPHWTPDKIETLLSRPIFDEATYGRVRLHHRSVREYLTAQWLYHLLKGGKSRRAVEGLLFATQYGVVVMVPSMRPVAAWLALRDDRVRRRIIEIAPEVLIEHGDPSRLPVGVRSQLLHTFAELYEGRTNTGASFDLASLRRLADPGLAATILELLDRDSANRDLQQALLGMIWQGQLADCADAALSFALDPSVDRYTRILGIRAVASAGEGRRLTWLVAWMCVDAAGALDALKIWLNRADDPTKADSRMISFCNALLGHREPRFGRIWLDFERIEVLRELVPSVYRHVRIEEDKTHEGSYTPDSRDDAESTRGYLLSRVVDTPSRQAFDTLMAFSRALPNQWSRDRMVVLARRRAAEDAEREAWSAADVATFARDAEVAPRSARDLFELALYRLDDLKLDLEEGDTSEAATLKRVDQETELRVWFASRLKHASRDRYSVASEEELADATRQDLRIDAPAIHARVPIELKIADKAHWTYPKLVERLRNQLVGQYMRDASSGFGIFLLVRRGTKQWTDPETGQRISFGELIERLQIEANSILGERNDINDIRIVGIDLTRRHIPRHAG